jgi:bifunctional enzyme CysN/CysC
MICRLHNQPRMTRDVEAMLRWTMRSRTRYLLRHTSRTVRAVVDDLRSRVDANMRHREQAGQLALNEIGRLHRRTGEQPFVD